MGYAKPEEIFKYIHNCNFNRYFKEYLTVIILEYCLVFSNCYRRANIMFIFLSMTSVRTIDFNGAKENSVWQTLILPLH